MFMGDSFPNQNPAKETASVTLTLGLKLRPTNETDKLTEMYRMNQLESRTDDQLIDFLSWRRTIYD